VLALLTWSANCNMLIGSPRMKDHSEFYKQVGLTIRSRRGKNLSQEALASAVGLTRTSISNIESGRQKMLLHTLVDIADALKVDASHLLPPRPAPVAPLGAETLAGLPENERAFIESAIGIKPQEKENNGRQEKKDSGVGTEAGDGSGNHRSARTRLGDRKGKGSAHRP
jgi:transcriptional regulator with XRE-family HTH domain